MKKEEENECTIVDYSQTCILYIFMVGIDRYIYIFILLLVFMRFCCWSIDCFVFIHFHSLLTLGFFLCCVFQEKYCACKASSYFTLLVETKSNQNDRIV